MLWRSAPPEIMMRSNAPITAISGARGLVSIACHAARQANDASSCPQDRWLPRPPQRSTPISRQTLQTTQPAPATPNTHTSTNTGRKHHPHSMKSRHRPADDPPRRKLCAPQGIPPQTSSGPQVSQSLRTRPAPAKRPNLLPRQPRPELQWPSPHPWSAWLAAPPPRGRSLRSVEEAAATPVILPTLYNKRGRLIVPAATQRLARDPPAPKPGRRPRRPRPHPRRRRSAGHAQQGTSRRNPYQQRPAGR